MVGDEEPQILAGGNTDEDVVRIGDTVRRPARPWSASIDALLLHLESVGFDGAPRALGYDEEGRQVLSFVPGRVDSNPDDLSLPRLGGVGRRIREFHDASSSFVDPVDAAWNVAIEPDRRELVCHNDLAPWNLVRGSDSLAIIDWDGAGPGSRLWDLSYAVHGFALLSARSGCGDKEVASRAAGLVEGYGLEGEDRVRLVSMLAPRIRSMHELLQAGKQDGTQPWSRLWDEGHGTVWLEDAAYAEQHSNLLLEALT